MSDAINIEIAALRALVNKEPDAPAKLAAFLRSSEPIGPVLREGLADALTGGTKSGVRLEMKGSGKRAKKADSLRATIENLAIGQRMDAQIDGVIVTREAATLAPDWPSRMSPEKANGALSLYRKAKPWLDGQRAFLKRNNIEWSDDKLFAAFHHCKTAEKQIAQEDKLLVGLNFEGR